MELDYEQDLTSTLLPSLFLLLSNSDLNTEYLNMMTMMTMILHEKSLRSRDGLPIGQMSGRSHALHNKTQSGSPMRRKEVQKRRECVSAVGSAGRGSMGESCLPDDMWAWRKYGQKPIKGSPHPRGYYRCSSSKGCPARKQVERSQTDCSMLLITYTFEHNHPFPTYRNALAGSTRHNLHPPTNTATTALVEEKLQVDADREVQISTNKQRLQVEKKVAESSQLAAEENYQESKEFQNYLLSELQHLDEGMSIYCHMGAFIGTADCEEDEAVLMEETSPIDPYNLFEWSSSPHLS